MPSRDSEYYRAWRLANPEKVKAANLRRIKARDPIKHNEYNKKWRKNNLHKTSAWARRRMYGLNQDQFDCMFLEQQGKCLACHTDMNPPVVDHCHATGKIRGLLCKNCNTSLGMAQDNPRILIALADYLEKP